MEQRSFLRVEKVDVPGSSSGARRGRSSAREGVRLNPCDECRGGCNVRRLHRWMRLDLLLTVPRTSYINSIACVLCRAPSPAPS
mmetsp:Transcript_39758/g.105304  ORF Transcript_39758/g.105304 Transcript_39758/m.105304 type:complete len:84 (+) Transcript_39758:1469-1720(+)